MSNKIILAALVPLVLAISCSKPESFEQKAIRAKLAESVGEITSMSFNYIEKIDSATFGDEIQARTKAFLLKSSQDKSFHGKYLAKGQLAKAQEKLEALQKDSKYVLMLDSIKTAMADRLDEVAYYDYKFSATGKSGDSKFEAIDWYACITPEGEVLSLVQEKKNLHKGTGTVIPGYSDMFDKE